MASSTKVSSSGVGQSSSMGMANSGEGGVASVDSFSCPESFRAAASTAMVSSSDVRWKSVSIGVSSSGKGGASPGRSSSHPMAMPSEGKASSPQRPSFVDVRRPWSQVVQVMASDHCPLLIFVLNMAFHAIQSLMVNHFVNGCSLKVYVGTLDIPSTQNEALI